MCVTRLTGLLNQQPNSHPPFLHLSTQHPRAYKREDGITVVHIFKIDRDIVQVSREGEVMLDTGGDRTPRPRSRRAASDEQRAPQVWVQGHLLRG